MNTTEKDIEKDIEENIENGIAGKDIKKEALYRCPYLLLLVVTVLGAMLCSDELASAILPAGWKIAAEAVEADGGALVPEGFISEEETGELASEGETGELASEGEIEKAASEGEAQNGEVRQASSAARTGITRFVSYEPRQTDSPYYSDAGRVAMTTEYAYTIENTSYFNDAAFLGDSRTLGISDYAGLDGADFYCENGMTIFKILGEEGVTEQRTGKKVNLNQVLREKQYGKIYLMLGMNELGYGNTQMYLEQYREVVEQIRQWQPEAVIYIMANLHVSREKDDLESEFNNININDKNAASATLANGTDIFYLDSNPLFTDEDGFLKEDYTFDGVHLYAQHYEMWRQFLLKHGVEGTGTPDAAQGTEEYTKTGTE
ncbi:MAG: GDSL-type esterase/lipase family protein [Clostridiales bacterium]|nr:GDSL-type esterase/lipase family protein [Clostridiales bacterium]